MNYLWLQKAPDNVILYFSTQEFFFSQNFGYFFLIKNNIGVKSQFFEEQRRNFWHGPKRLKKNFFFSRPEKKGLIMYFLYLILCVIWKFAKVPPPQFFFQSVGQFLTILWSALRYSFAPPKLCWFWLSLGKKMPKSCFLQQNDCLEIFFRRNL